MITKPTFRLGEKEIEEFRYLAEEEFGQMFTGAEIKEMAVNLLEAYHHIYSDCPDSPKVKVNENEFRALRYVHNCLYHKKCQPTARGMAEALGWRSSRSGFRMIQRLGERGLIRRRRGMGFEMCKDVAGCSPGVLMMAPQ